MNRRLKLSHSVAAGALLLAGGCASTVDRIAQIGEAPPMAAVANPVEKPDYRPVTTPLPAPDPAPKMANSLWRPGAKAFFRDQRAARVGDILTVNVQIADEANVNNTTTRARTAEETMGMPGLFGLETQLGKVLPEGVDPAALVGVNGAGNFQGEGAVQREETVNLTVAAMVVQVLPNGNLVISGRQEVRVNFEVRELTVAGIVRPEDISATNVVSHTQIAEARISYGGRGQITDVQQPRYGQQLLDIIAPF
jgi:flagellar L-ring protein precursor FlgH